MIGPKSWSCKAEITACELACVWNFGQFCYLWHSIWPQPGSSSSGIWGSTQRFCRWYDTVSWQWLDQPIKEANPSKCSLKQPPEMEHFQISRSSMESRIKRIQPCTTGRANRWSYGKLHWKVKKDGENMIAVWPYMTSHITSGSAASSRRRFAFHTNLWSAWKNISQTTSSLFFSTLVCKM